MSKLKGVVLNIPHSLKKIPLWTRNQFLPDKNQMKKELILMTDFFTEDLYLSHSLRNAVVAKVSRLVVDTERFSEDSQESMSKAGMGAVYSRTSEGKILRREISVFERVRLLKKYYRTHHLKLERKVQNCLEKFGYCLIIDCHSYSSFRQKYEISESEFRPEICIGTDSFHTEKWIEEIFTDSFMNCGFEVGINSPFSGSLVPLKFYQKDKRIQSIMIEIRRDLYMDERSGRKNKSYKVFKKQLNMIMEESCKIISEQYLPKNYH